MKSVAIFVSTFIWLPFLLVSSAVANAARSGWIKWTEYCGAHETAIVSDETNISERSPGDIKSLELTDKSLEKCGTWGHLLTNLVSLRITSEDSDPIPELISAATNFPKLQYLHMQIRNACRVPASIVLLTNLTNLGYLGLDVQNATNIDGSVYDLPKLNELFLRSWKAPLPDGVSRLRFLASLEIVGRRTNAAAALPKDLSTKSLRYLEVLGVSGIDRLLPILPPNLLELQLAGCRLNEIPSTWPKHRKLQILGLTTCELTEFPTALINIPSLTELNLNFNRITEVPPLKIARGRRLKIYLSVNPIQHFAPENDALVKRGNIEK